MSGSSEHAVPQKQRIALIVVLLGAAYLAISLHRNGHTQGDDFALYIRQARSLFEGDSAAVIADNRFAVLNSDPAFSPIGYPWGWPVILAPFVHFWGYDYDRLKLVVVALFCVWLLLLHGVVRRRVGRWPALGIVAAFGTAPAFLAHTDQLITEIPHLAAVVVFLWLFDRVTSRSTLIGAPTRDLVMLGVAAAVVFNVRREGLVLAVVMAAIQLYDLFMRDGRNPAAGMAEPPLDVAESADESTVAEPQDRGWRTLGEVFDLARASRWSIAAPHVAFVGAVALFQLLLPTALLPDNGNSPSNIGDRFGEYPSILSDQLGLGKNAAIGGLILAVAVVGIVVGLRQRPRLDGAILVLAVVSSFLIGTHIRKVERYWFQVTPWVVYFVIVACLALVHLVVKRRDSITRVLAAVPLGVLVIAHGLALPDDVTASREYNEAGRVQVGPANPTVIPIYDAVRELTPPDAVVAFFRARTMTLMTERRSFQTSKIDKIVQSADYFAQKRVSTYWQPDLATARQAGFEEVWSNSDWVLWRVETDGPPNDLGIEAGQ